MFGGGGGSIGSKGTAPGIGAAGVPNPYAGLRVGGAKADGTREVAGNGFTGTVGCAGANPGEVLLGGSPVAVPGDGVVAEDGVGVSPGKVPGAAPNGLVGCTGGAEDGASPGKVPGADPKDVPGNVGADVPGCVEVASGGE